MPKSILKILLTNEQKQTMSDVYSLLNINQGMLQDFRLLADRVADHQTEKVVNKNMSKLKQIEERMLVDKGLEVAQQSVDEVISKVIRMAPSGDTSAFVCFRISLRIPSSPMARSSHIAPVPSYTLRICGYEGSSIP